MAFLILDPIKAPANSFVALLLNGVVGKNFTGGVFYADLSRWLGMPQFGQGIANGGRLLLIDEDGSNFGFSRRGHDVAHDLGDGIDGSVEGQVGGWRFMGLHRALTGEVVDASTAVGVGSEM